MANLLPFLLPLVGTLAGVSATVLIAQHRSSGKIATSEAADLWAASESIRRDLTEEIKALRAEVSALKAQNIALTGDLQALRQKLMGGWNA